MITEHIKALLAESNSFGEDLIASSKIDGYAEKICNNANIICIYREGKLAGFIAYYDNNIDHGIGYLTMLVIAKEHRSKGFGKLLLESSLRDLKNKKFIKYRLEVLKKNKKTLDLYVKYGFVRMEDRGKVWLMEADL